MFELMSDNNVGYDPYNSADRPAARAAMWRRINADPANAWILDELKSIRSEAEANRSMFHVKQAG